MDESVDPRPKSRRGGRRPGAGRPPKNRGAGATPPAEASAATPGPAATNAEKPIGAPPSYLSAEARKAWRELAGRAKPGTLTWRHGPWLEGVACLMARLRDAEFDASVAEVSRLQAALARLGLVPGA